MFNTTIWPNIGQIRRELGAREGGVQVNFPKISLGNRKQVTCITSGVQVFDIFISLQRINLLLPKLFTYVKKLKNTPPSLTVMSPQVFPWVTMGKGGYAKPNRFGQVHSRQLCNQRVPTAKVGSQRTIPNHMVMVLDLCSTLTLAIRMLAHFEKGEIGDSGQSRVP